MPLSFDSNLSHNIEVFQGGTCVRGVCGCKEGFRINDKNQCTADACPPGKELFGDKCKIVNKCNREGTCPRNNKCLYDNTYENGFRCVNPCDESDCKLNSGQSLTSFRLINFWFTKLS